MTRRPHPFLAPALADAEKMLSDLADAGRASQDATQDLRDTLRWITDGFIAVRRAMVTMLGVTGPAVLVEAAFRGHAWHSGEHVCDGHHELLTERCAYCRGTV